VSHGLAEVCMWSMYPALLEALHDQCKMGLLEPCM